MLKFVRLSIKVLHKCMALREPLVSILSLKYEVSVIAYGSLHKTENCCQYCKNKFKQLHTSSPINTVRKMIF